MGLLQLYIYVCVFMCMNTYINAWIDVVLECPWDGAADGSPPAIYIYVCVYPYACIHIYMHKLRTCINTYCIRMSVRRCGRRASSSNVYMCACIHMHVYTILAWMICIHKYILYQNVHEKAQQTGVFQLCTYSCACIHMRVYIYTCMNYVYTWIHIVSECPWEGAADGRHPTRGDAHDKQAAKRRPRKVEWGIRICLYIFTYMYIYICIHIYICIYI